MKVRLLLVEDLSGRICATSLSNMISGCIRQIRAIFLTKRDSKLLKLAPCPHEPALKFSPIVKRWILSRRVTNIIDFNVFSGLTQKDLHCVPIKTVVELPEGN